MKFHTDDEEALLETLRQNGGRRIFFHRRGRLKVEPSVAKTLSRLIRSGHIERAFSGDFNYICYRLKESVSGMRAELAPNSSEDSPAREDTVDAPTEAAAGDRNGHSQTVVPNQTPPAEDRS